MHRTLFIALTAIACTPIGTNTVIEGYDFAGGDFLFETTTVIDECGNGVFAGLFTPPESGGADESAEPVTIPSWSEMEGGTTIEFQLQAALQPMTMTIAQGAAEGDALLSDGALEDVALDDDAHGDCTTDLTMDGTMELVSDDEITGSATVGVDNLQGERCPQVTEGCVVLLEFSGLSTGDE